MSQQAVTADLRQWIVAQASAGHRPEVVLKSMIASGWNEDVAVQAMEETLTAHLSGLAPTGLGQSAAAVAVPEPALRDAPLYLDAGDRRVAVLSMMANPRVVVFGSLLSDEECTALIESARPHMARSLTVATQTGDEELHEDRTSYGMFFKPAQTALVARVEARIAKLLNWPVENGEGLQVLQYRPGAQYKPHYDYFDPKEPGTPRILQRGGQRVATLVMYLAEPEKGGGTTFPDAQLEVQPQRGNAVFFSYNRADPSTRTLHGGAPVIEGEKWIATKWLRERRFE